MKIKSFFFIAILLVLSLYYISLRIVAPDTFIFFSCALLTLMCLLVFFTHSQNGVLKNHWLKPSYIILISYLIVSFQYPLDFWMGYKSSLRYPLAVNHCIVLETIGLISFFLGYCWKNISYSEKAVVPSNDKRVNTPVFLIILQFLLLLIYVSVTDIRLILSGEGYALGYTNIASAYSELLFFSVNVAIVYRRIKCRKENISFWQYIKSYNPFFLLLFLLYIVLKFVSGDRGPMIYNVLLFFFGFISISERKIKLLWLISFFIISAAVLSILGITRQTNVGESNFVERFKQSSTEYSESGRFGEATELTILPATEELAGSFSVTLAAVNAIVYDKIDYNNGIYFFVNVLNTIPFFSSLSAPYLTSVNSSSTDFANSYMNINGYSVGTTLISDLYLDLGLLWVIFGMLLIGLFFYRLDYVLCCGGSSKNNILLIVSLCYASCAISIPRSTFFAPVKYVLWTCIILLIDKLFHNTSVS